MMLFLGCVCVWAITAPQAFGFVLTPTGALSHATAARGLPPAHRPATHRARMGLFDGIANKVRATRLLFDCSFFVQACACAQSSLRAQLKESVADVTKTATVQHILVDTEKV